MESLEIYEPGMGKVIVRPFTRDEVTEGGIVIPETAEDSEPTKEGIVVAIGPEYLTESGDHVPFAVGDGRLVHPGERVVFPASAGITLTLNDQKYVEMEHADVLSVRRTVTRQSLPAADYERLRALWAPAEPVPA